MIEQLPLTIYTPMESRRGEPVAAFVLHGDPQAWARPKPMLLGKTSKIIERFQGKYRRWRLETIERLALYWQGKGNLRPVRVPLILRVEAVFSRPAGPPEVTIDGELVRYPWPWTPGRNFALVPEDIDNIVKAVLDCAQREHKDGAAVVAGPLLGNDRWVVELEARKRYAAIGEEPRTEVRLWRAA